MSFKLSELLNPAPSSKPASPDVKEREQQQALSPTRLRQSPDPYVATEGGSRQGSFSSYAHARPPTTAYEAADTLTTLAHNRATPALSCFPPPYGEPYSSHHADAEQHNEYQPARRTSSYGSIVAPLEPPPPLGQHPTNSPTLDQYHHGSHSPEQQRRSSFASPPASAPILPPIQSLTSSLNGHRETSAPARRESYGQDTSHFTAPSFREGMSNSTGHVDDIARNRETDYVRNEPSTTQIREPSPGAAPPPLQPPVQEAQRSPHPHIKPEPSTTSREGTPVTVAGQTGRKGSVADGAVDHETLKTIAALKSNDLGLRGTKRETVSPSAEGPAQTVDSTAAQPPRKRPAPKATAATKKGMAKKPPAKKRKVESDADTESVAGSTMRRSATPSSRPGKPSGKPKKSHSGTPLNGSSPAPFDHSSVRDQSSEPDHGDDGSVEDENEVFCICRKPDNHTWMIACDGGCDDWFHGRCVNMREEDGDLIDKYICPNCADMGRGNTTWKPMCRRDGCRQPARLAKSNPSKYCTDECGLRFFRERLNAGDEHVKAANKVPTPSKRGRDRRKANYTDNVNADSGNLEEETNDVGPRGGVLRAAELKALVTGIEDVGKFRSLGSGVLSPPLTTSPTKSSFPVNGIDGAAPAKGDDNTTGQPLSCSLNDAESAQIAELSAQKDTLRAQYQLLKEREVFVGLVRDQATRYAEREGVKPKDLCGFDGRLSWTDAEFTQWRSSKSGQTALKLNTLEPADPVVNGVKPEVADDEAPATHGTDGDMEVSGTAFDSRMCSKKRCDRHKQWQKLALQDVRFEQSVVSEQMKRADAAEREVRERAMVRWRTEVVMAVDGANGAVPSQATAAEGVKSEA